MTAMTVAVVVGAPASAGAAPPGVHGTAAGAALARAALLTRAQLGHGWRAAPAPRRAAPMTCGEFDPTAAGANQIGARATGRFSDSSSGPFVSQAAYAYATIADGEAAARAVMRRRLVSCIAGSLTGGSTRQVKFRVSRHHGLALRSLGVNARGYRVVGTASQPEQTVAVYLDAIVLAHAQVVTELSLASFDAPPPRHLELRLARLVAHRLTAR